jgi:hypothetical protein
MSSFPFVENSDVFNSANYNILEEGLTIETANKLYLSLSGGVVSGPTTFSSNINSIVYQLNGSSILMSALTSVTAGAGSASKALVLDTSRNINNINVLTASEYVLASNIRLVTSAGVNYIQSGTALTANSSADLFVGNMLNTFSASSRAFMIKATTGKVGIQSYAPTKQLDINSSTGGCLRLQYNSSTDGTGTNNVDFDVSSGGDLTITASGENVIIPTVNGGDILKLSSSNSGARTTLLLTTDSQNWEFGARGSTATQANNLYIWNGRFNLLMTPSGDTTLNAKLNISTSTSHLTLTNGGFSGFLEVPGSTDMLRIVRGNCINLSSNGLFTSGNSTQDARCKLDLGADASNMIVSIFNNTTSYYGFSANNSAMQLSSGGSAGFQFYASCTNASPINTNVMTIGNSGTVTAVQNVIAGTGFWAKQAFSSTGRTGIGAALVMGNSTYAECYAYDYGTSQYKPIYIGNVMYVNNASQSVNIGGGINPGLYPLTVNGSSSTTFSPYGYLSNSSYGTGGSSGVVPVSIWASARISCTEFNAYSDFRLKENIENLAVNDCLEFITRLNPKIYNWKTDKNNLSIGYIAQDILRLKNKKWDTLVSLSEDQELKEIIDDDGFIHPKGKRFQVNYSGAIPILHQALKHSLELIEKQETRLEEVVKSANAAHEQIKDLNEKINKTNARMLTNNALIHQLKEIINCQNLQKQTTTATAPIAIEYLDSIKN